jgi:hypothetical protein
MNGQMHRAMVFCVLFSLAVATYAQEGEPAMASSVEVSDSVPTTLDKCFTAENFVALSVMTDQHAYFRTRGGNHYLVTTDLCPEMRRSYRRATLRFVPKGRTVCENDGSYFLYDDSGRDSICPISTINRVFNRQEAQQLAAGTESPVVLEEILPVE